MKAILLALPITLAFRAAVQSGIVPQRLQGPPPRRHLAPVAAADGSAADGSAGSAESRAALERLFRVADAEGGSAAAVASSTLREDGVITDLPLWRVQWSVLPGFNQLLNVHVPHYTHMFSQLADAPSEGARFGHLLLPGGSENLGDPRYALEPGTEAPLVGVLMQVRAVVPLSEGRMQIVAHALCRFEVMRATQTLPYSRADVRLLPDSEEIILLDHDDADGGALVGAPEGAREGAIEGAIEGAPEGAPEGAREGAPEGAPAGAPKGAREGAPEGALEGAPEGAKNQKGAITSSSDSVTSSGSWCGDQKGARRVAAVASSLEWASREMRVSADGDDQAGRVGELTTLEPDLESCAPAARAVATRLAKAYASRDAREAGVADDATAAQSDEGVEALAEAAAAAAAGMEAVAAFAAAADPAAAAAAAAKAMEKLAATAVDPAAAVLASEQRVWCELIRVTELARQLLTTLDEDGSPIFLVLRTEDGDQQVPVSIPSQILELLPPPPSGGWPGKGNWSSSRRVLSSYPSSRRAQRLSFCVASLLPSLDRQRLLEAASIISRLQIEMDHLEAIRGKLQLIVALRSSQLSIEGIGEGEDDGYPSATA